MNPSPEPTPTPGGSPYFQTTHWSVVLAAGETREDLRGSALASLCKAYWFPVYAYIRRRGSNHHDAQDLTQEYFCRMLQKGGLETADPERGRFRTFVLSSLKNFLANEWDKERAKKRGGEFTFITIDDAEAQRRVEEEHASTVSPDQAFDRNWALAVLDQSIRNVEDHYRKSGKHDLFQKLEPCLSRSGGNSSYKEIGIELGMTEDAVKMAVLRLRGRFRQALHREVANTLSDLRTVDREVAVLLAKL